MLSNHGTATISSSPTVQKNPGLLQVHAQKHKLAEDVDLRQLAQDVPGLVGADLANLLNEAALSAVRDSASTITASHVQVRGVPSASAFSWCLLFDNRKFRRNEGKQEAPKRSALAPSAPSLLCCRPCSLFCLHRLIPRCAPE